VNTTPAAEGARVQCELAALLAAVDAETGNNLWAELDEIAEAVAVRAKALRR
jgi:hypothetical protein